MISFARATVQPGPRRRASPDAVIPYTMPKFTIFAAERAFGERVAVNTVVQGSAADLIKLAMVELDAALAARFPRARLLLQIHDELLVEAPTDDAPAVSELLSTTMRSAMHLKVPLEVSAAIGPRWSDV